ncbi:MAG: hypothetical protein OXI41_01775 [Chloroflexota bacterium]|nr:hypothetical protein [Chloroflexota bacterium]MDE2894193.1 hypothetical protein [Chloroflexota bacterium]
MRPDDEEKRPTATEDPWNRLVHDALSLMDHPATPVAPHHDRDDDPVRGVDDETERVTRALRAAVNKIPDSSLIQASSSAFHIQPLLEELCRVFERPVKTIAISKDGYVTVNLATDETESGEARLAMGPHGEGAKYVRSEKSQRHGFLSSETAAFLSNEAIGELAKAGLRLRDRSQDILSEPDASS